MTTRINDNLMDDGGRVRCVHCGHVVAEPGEHVLQRALTRRGDIRLAGPHIRTGVPKFVTADVEFRQRLCPGCYTALLTEVAAVEDVDTRHTRITPSSR